MTENNKKLSEIRSEIPSGSLNAVSAAVEAEITIDSLDVPQSQEEVIELVHELEQNQNIEIIVLQNGI